MRPPVWQLVCDAVKTLNGELAYSDIKKRIWETYPDVNSATITCTIICSSVNHPSRVHYPENKKPRICTSQYDFLFNTGRGKVISYDPDKHGRWEIAQTEQGLKVGLFQEATSESETGDFPEDDQSGSFALEAHLRDYLARNLPALQDAGQLKLFVTSDARDGVEFQTDVGPIDILAVSSSGDFYVFELKLGRGADAALGQILRYMGWVNEHLCVERNVYGIVVASEISKKLKYAATQVPNVRLMEYELTIKLTSTKLENGA